MHRFASPLTIIIALLGSPTVQAEQSDRPVDLTLANFQDGPYNRWAFNNIREVMTTVNIASDRHQVLALDRHPGFRQDIELDFWGQRLALDAIAEQQFVDGVLVLKDGQIIAERYYKHLSPEQPHLMMSVSKSVVGLLSGILAEQGIIDLEKSVGDYVPELASSGWGPDSLRTLLDMRDGADYTEDYDDLTSTVRLQDCAAGWNNGPHCVKNGPRGGYEFFPTVGRNAENLGKFVYKSGSTDVIGWVLEAATGEPLAELISKHIWKPMGAEFDAYITVDSGGFVLADGGMNATLRDLGRFGQLVLNDGQAFGKQVVPKEFLEDIHHQAGDPNWPYPGSPPDWAPYYRSFWWGQGNAGRDVMGLGINGQLLQVAPEAGIVVVVYSSWPWADGDENSDYWGRLYALGGALVNEFR